MAYLIPCSSKKRTPCLNPSSLEKLSFSDELLDARLEILNRTGIQLNWNNTLPAWQLYSGKIYTKISQNNWLKEETEIRILSALFGWIKHTDLIPMYDLQMNKKFNNLMPYRYWRENQLLKNLIFEEDIDLLSKSYKKGINHNMEIIASRPAVKFTDRGDQMGKWLNEQLNLF
jgi:cytoplasmic iron level regulating protein YaaA (DUF328/UPF0246 family)